MRKITQLQLQKKLKDLDKVADGLGLGIDPGIKETVALLNLAGVNTSASCEGHANWGYAYPWVDIEHKDSWELHKKLMKISDFESLECKELVRRITELNTPICNNLYKLLKKFYRHDDTSIKAMLVISSYGHGSGRLQSRQEYIYEGDKKAYAQHARLAKAEMSRFAEFLKSQML